MAGRPKFQASDEQTALIVRLARCGISEREMAPAIGIDRKTLRLRFGDLIARERLELRLALIENIIEQAEDGNDKCVAYVLKMLQPRGDVEKPTSARAAAQPKVPEVLSR